MTVRSISAASIHWMKTTRAKGGYEVWSMAIHSPIDAETWMTRMGAARKMVDLKKLYPNVEMSIVYVHYLSDPKRS